LSFRRTPESGRPRPSFTGSPTHLIFDPRLNSRGAFFTPYAVFYRNVYEAIAKVRYTIKKGEWRHAGNFHVLRDNSPAFFFDNDEHNKPHIHARYAEFTASVDIRSAELLEGEIPLRQL
jgi:hypothetical protein